MAMNKSPKILLAPDSFKGSLSAGQVCEALAQGINDLMPDAEVISIPLADGGEGSLEAINYSLQAEEVKQFVKDPLWRTITASYLRKGETAYIEMAAASGLGLVKTNQRDPELATTYGTGQQIKHAVKNGAKTVYLFIGGSATNDAGLGIGQALGFKFYDKKGVELLAGGESLAQISTLRAPENPFEFDLKVVCDVQNPLYGENGAAFIYAPQKGADQSMVERLDQGLRNFAEIVKTSLGKDVSQLPGGGAAGGVGAGMVAFFDAEILPGIESIMELLDFDTQLKDVDYLITGEGRLDQQTLSGKLIAGVAKKAKEKGIISFAVCGKNELSKENLKQLGISQVAVLTDPDISVEYAMEHGAELLSEKVKMFFQNRA